jgi:hypothetical protein
VVLWKRRLLLRLVRVMMGVRMRMRVLVLLLMLMLMLKRVRVRLVVFLHWSIGLLIMMAPLCLRMDLRRGRRMNRRRRSGGVRFGRSRRRVVVIGRGGGMVVSRGARRWQRTAGAVRSR